MATTGENNRKKRGLLLCEYIRQRAESKRQMEKNSTADLYLAAGCHFIVFRKTKTY